MAGIGDAVNAVLQPVHGDIGVEAGIVDDAGKMQDKEQPKRERQPGRRQKESSILTHQFAAR